MKVRSAFSFTVCFSLVLATIGCAGSSADEVAKGGGGTGGVAGQGGQSVAGAAGWPQKDGGTTDVGTGGSGGAAGDSGGSTGGSGGSTGGSGGSTGGSGGSTGGSGGSSTCSPPAVRSCGSSNVGQCRYGQESCVQPGTWSGQCQGNIEPTAETCDGKDQDCDGAVDNGTFLPNTYDSLEWIKQGFFGLNAGILMTWGNIAAVWDRDSSKVSSVSTLNDIWAMGTGSLPPNSSIDAMILVPNGTFGKTSDFIWVTAGPNVYSFDGSDNTWTSTTLQSLIGLPSVKAAAVLFAGDLGLTEDTLFVTSGSNMYSWTVSAGISAPTTSTSVLCPSGSTGCPPGVDSMARFADASSNVFLIVGYQNKSYITPLITGQPFTWQPIDMSTVSCAK